MWINDLFKLKYYKSEIESLTLENSKLSDENKSLNSVMTDEHGHAIEIKQHITQLERRETELKSETDNQVTFLENL